MTALRLYSVDTSALIDGLERYYPEDAFPALWQRVEELIGQGRFFVSEEVWEEVQAKDAVVKTWCQGRKDGLVVPTDVAVAQEVQRILVDHERLVMNMKGRNRADPFVVAVAVMKKAVVVTGETHGTADRPKIPYVCQQLGIECIGFLDLIKLEGWKF